MTISFPYVVKKSKEQSNFSLLKKSNSTVKKSFSRSNENHLFKDEAKQKLMIRFKDHVEIVPLNSIVHIKAETKYTRVYLADNTFIFCSVNIRAMQEKLNKSFFFRCHKSHLININHIKSFSANKEHYIELINKEKVPLARMRKEDFLKEMERHFIG